MIAEVKIPSPGESISEVEISNWLVKSGDFVEKDQEVGEVESEKATLPLIAVESGEISILKEIGDTVAVGEVVCKIDTSKKVDNKKSEPAQESKKEEIKKESSLSLQSVSENTVTEKEIDSDIKKIKATPVAKKMMDEYNVNVDDIVNGLRKISKTDVEKVISTSNKSDASFSIKSEAKEREDNRTKMSSLRRKLSQRLVSVKNETAMLTTFNEVDMSEIIALRKKHQPKFLEKHNIKLGFMSFFTKAAAIALQTYPKVNSQIDGDEIITPNYSDIGIAVQTDKGLMVPIIRNAESLSLADIEIKLADLAKQARKNRISIEDLKGGTFSITNGGVFGSLLSTPIINPPQSAILGMHNIVERPIAVKGKVEIRPMMYLALSYDHRIIDGKDSVTFLVKIKELVEDPKKMLFGGSNPEELLLEL